MEESLEGRMEEKTEASDGSQMETADGSHTQAPNQETDLTQLKNVLAARLETKNLDLRGYSPLTLAYIGDVIYELLIRTMVVAAGNTNNRTLHQKTVRYVKAESQAKMMTKLLPLLTEEEAGVYKRGRNAKMASRTRSASLGDYKKATGFEALMGYLYLRGDYDRMLALTAAGLTAIEL